MSLVLQPQTYVLVRLRAGVNGRLVATWCGCTKCQQVDFVLEPQRLIDRSARLDDDGNAWLLSMAMYGGYESIKLVANVS